MAKNEPTKDQIKTLKWEIQMAKKFNKEELKARIAEGIERYLGCAIPDCGGDWDIVLNEIYPVVQNHLPAIFFRNPKAFLKPRTKTFVVNERQPETGKRVRVVKDSSKSAQTQESIVNYQLVEIKYKNETRRALLDSLLFPFSVLWHGYKGNFGMTQEASIHSKKDRVFVKRISPLRFLKDPSVSFEFVDDGRWVGRSEDFRLEDILEDETLKITKELKGFTGFGEMVRDPAKAGDPPKGRQGDDTVEILNTPLLDFTDDEFKKSMAAKFITIDEVFLRPTRKQMREGSKGWILLMTDEQKEPLRIDPWSIKAEGFPAKLLMFNPVPEKTMPMPDIDTYSSIADQKNVITNLQIRNAEENTKTWVAINKAGADEEDIEKIRIGENTIIMFDDEGIPVGNRMQVSSPGGTASSELYLIDQRIQKNLDEKAGVTDLQKGFLQSGEESAASVNIRAAGASLRAQYRQDVMKDFLTESITYLVQLNKQFLPFDEAVRIMGTLDITWSEDPTIEDVQADVDVELDVVSMLPDNPEQELRRLQAALNTAILTIQDPVIRRKVAEEGKTVNITPLIEQILIRQRILQPDVFRNITPEESQGFVSVAEIRAAKKNVQISLSGQGQIEPPQPGMDHVARLEIYSAILELLEEQGESQAKQTLNALVQAHVALLEEEQKVDTKPGQVIPTEG